MSTANQMSPQQMAQVSEAKRRLVDLRSSIAAYKTARAKTQELVQACKKMPQDRAMQLAAALRDSNMEQKAAQSIVDLNRVLRGRDPTAMEVEFGVPSDAQLGLLPLIPIALIVAGGAWGTSAIFNYLTAREQRIQAEINPSSIQGLIPSWAGTAAIVVGGVIVGGYLYFKLRKKPEKKAPVKETIKEVYAQNPSDEEDEDCEDDSCEESEE